MWDEGSASLFQALRAKIAEMPWNDRVTAARIHEIVIAAVPDLVRRTSYGMTAAMLRTRCRGSGPDDGGPACAVTHRF